MARDWLIVYLLYSYSDFFFSFGIIGKFIWWNLTGFYGWCLFVVGHDCGHGSFSEYKLLNDILGHINHAPLCVPFHGWRISHRAHHQYHNDVDHDHSWRPLSKKSYSQSGIIPTYLFRFTPLLLILYPIYLITESRDAGFSGNHFNPFSKMFKKEERPGAALSAFLVLAWLVYLFSTYSLSVLFQKYWIPYLIFVAWLDLVTYMQHTDGNVVYYRGKGWDYLKGAISTVDRTYKHLIDPFGLGYGRLLDHLHHNISDAHVIHHLFFTQIPHYRLREATDAILPILGKYYRFDSTPIHVAFWKSIQECHFVEDEGEKLFYQGKDKAQGLMGFFPKKPNTQ